MNYYKVIDDFWRVDTCHKRKYHDLTNKGVYLTERRTQLHYSKGGPNDDATDTMKTGLRKKLDPKMTMTTADHMGWGIGPCDI